MLEVVALLLGIGIGALGTWLLMRGVSRAQQLEDELHALQSEYDAYKASVSGHFTQSAELFEELTDRYKAVYQHLAQSATQLCPDETSLKRIRQAGEQFALPPEPEPAAPPPHGLPAAESPAPTPAAEVEAETRGESILDEDEHAANAAPMPPRDEPPRA